MFIRLLKFGFIGSFLQIFFYWFFYNLVQTISSLFSNSNFISDTGLVYSIGLFGFILLVQNIFVSMIYSKIFTRIMIYCVSAVIILAWSEDLDSRPYSTICCMLISIVTILSKIYIDKFLSYYLVEVKPNG